MTSVLAVEDREDLGSLISDALIGSGFVLISVTGSKEAFSKFGDLAPEIVILDYDTLEGKKCFELASKILSTRSSTRIIVLAPPGADLEHMERIGVDVFLIKPIPKKKLLDSITTLSRMKPPLKIVAR